MAEFDDPTLPLMPLDPQPFRDWHDFMDKVVIPVIEGSELGFGTEVGQVQVQEAMRLFRLCNPYWLCVCMYMAAKSPTPYPSS